MTAECSVCGREFPSKVSLGSHKAAGHDKPWMDEETLVREYVEKGRTSYDIANEWGCDSASSMRWAQTTSRLDILPALKGEAFVSNYP